MIPGRIPGRELWEVEDKLYISNAVDQKGELRVYGGTAGEKSLEVFNGSTSIFHILATSTSVRLMGGASKPITIGDAGSTSRSLNTNDDLFVSGELEVDGISYFDGVARFYSGFNVYDNQNINLGTSADSKLDWSTAQATAETLVWGLGDTAKSIIFCDAADSGVDFDHAAQSNPTIFVHSNTIPSSANDEWISISHDVTDGVIAVGSGTLNLGGSTVNFVNATRTGSGDAVMDGYCTLEIGGTAYKFMLTA